MIPLILILAIIELDISSDEFEYLVKLELLSLCITLYVSNYISSTENFYTSFFSYILISSYSVIPLFYGLINPYKLSSNISSTLYTLTLSIKLGLSVFTFYTLRIYSGLPFTVSLFHLTVTKLAYFIGLITLLNIMPLSEELLNNIIYSTILSTSFIFIIYQEFIATLTASSLSQYVITLLPMYNEMIYNVFDILSIYYIPFLMIISIILLNYVQSRLKLISYEMIYNLVNTNVITISIILLLFISLAGVPPTIGIFSKVLGLSSISTMTTLSVVFILSTIFPIYFYLYELKVIAYSPLRKMRENNMIGYILSSISYVIYGTYHNVFKLTSIII